MTERLRFNPDKRREIIVAAIHRIAKESTPDALTHGKVAKRCSVITSVSTVRHYFATKQDLIDAATSD